MFKKIEQTMQPVGESLQNAGSGLGEILKDPTVLSMLIGGAGAGIAGGYLSSRVKGNEGEDKSKRRKRILANALLAGAAGAGASGLGATAYRSLKTALPSEDVDPATSILTPLMRLGATGGVGAYLHNRGMQAESPAQTTALRQLLKQMTNSDNIQGGISDRSLYSNIAEQIKGAIKDGGPADRRDAFFDLHERATRGELNHLTDAFPDKHIVERAGGIGSYDPGEAKFWFNREAYKGLQTNPKELFRGTATGRFGKRLFGGLGRTPAGVGLSAGALGLAALSPEILGLIAKGVTGHE